MKVNGSYKPNALEYEVLNNGKAIIRLYENIAPVKEPESGDEMSGFNGWEFDRYTIQLPHSNRLELTVKANIPQWLEFAKEQERQAEIDNNLHSLKVIDQEVDAGRHVRDVTLTAGEALDGFRFIIAWLVKKLGFTAAEDFGLPKDFGKNAVTIAEIQALAPPQKTKDETEEQYSEKVENFMVWRTLRLFNRLDPTLNEGMTRIKAAEAKAIPIRQKLAELTQ